MRIDMWWKKHCCIPISPGDLILLHPNTPNQRQLLIISAHRRFGNDIPEHFHVYAIVRDHENGIKEFYIPAQDNDKLIKKISTNEQVGL